jgi:hypothetical protein
MLQEVLEALYLDCALILPIWLIYVYVLGGASCDLAGGFIERDGFELEFLVDVDSLENVVRSVENDERISRDICLTSLRISYGRVWWWVRGCRTMIWFPSHRPWVTACSLACGRPGSMPRMEYLKAFATRTSLSREYQTAKRSVSGVRVLSRR